MAEPLLEVNHLTMRFGGLVAVDDLNFTCFDREITAIIGPNGAGKTTVFNCITGFYKPTVGRLLLRGDRDYLLERMLGHEVGQRARVARTFQNIRLFPAMTVLENLLVAQHNKLMQASGYTVLGLFGFSGYRKASAESIDLAKHWLEKANLIDRADDPAGDLPYGAQRRLEIARAMCTGPELLCLDEPAAGLNPKESAALNALLNDIKTTTSILLIEHDMSVVMQISDHVVVLEYGRKISDGDPTSVKSDPRVIAAYLGVEDVEVTDVLAEVGDEQVIEELEGEPDRAHGPSDSSSMMAGPVSDTVRHEGGEIVRISRSASKADQYDHSVSVARPQAISNALQAPRGGKPDRLTRIKGIGPVNEKKLNEHGIFHFDQIAAWSEADIKAAEAYLAFDGRIAREDWVGQAKALAAKSGGAE
jgi:branched-chain amino acid transport system ATP-binding protein